MNEKIYVSTTAFGNIDLPKISQISLECSINLEFSSNVLFDPLNIDCFYNHNGLKLIHNYFPAPKTPFVINLASENKEILKLSIEHIKDNIIRTAELNLPFYAAHAGFCLDPKISSLGKIISVNKKIDRSRNINIFLESLKQLVSFATENGVVFLMENNVLSKDNFDKNNNQNIFLCTDSKEIIMVLEEVNSINFGLLLDTAHLKVSSTTLKKNLLKEASILLPFTRGVHHSENDGLSDSNLKLNENYWFLQYMKDLKDIYHVIEVKNISPKIIKNQIKILNDAF